MDNNFIATLAQTKWQFLKNENGHEMILKLVTLHDDCDGQMAGKQQPPKYRAYPGEQKGFATVTPNEGFPSAFKNRADNGKFSFEARK